jgi:PQQ-dependent dehydrogenase (methanol/ethanol family)
MRRSFGIPFAAALLLGAVACEPGPGPESSVDHDRLVAADADSANWLMYGRTYEEHRFSPLAQISEETIGDLGLLWSREMSTTRGLEGTPLVLDGVLYVTGSWSIVSAIDARTGDLLWTHDPLVDRARVSRFICCDVVNRGVALYADMVFVGTLDGRLIALDRATGDEVWNTLTVDPAKPFAITGYPRVADGLVLIGNAGAEFGVRGYVSAYDARTGEMVWRTYTVPGDPSLGFESEAMARAADTWSGEWWEVGGGGTVWEGIVYDPGLDMVYFGTGNATTWYRALRGEGDNLYAASILALDARTGEYIWHFQTAPGDNWDFDSTQPLMFAQLEIDGRPRDVIMQAPKSGFFYVLDRATGEYLSGTPYVDRITWATGLDASGRPIESDIAYTGTEPTIVSPGPAGAHNWNPMAFHPGTGLVYIPAKVGTKGLHAPDEDWTFDPADDNIGYDEDYDGSLDDLYDSMPAPAGELLAWDPVARRAAWRAPHPVVEGGGVLASAGNLVLQGRSDGILAAYRATDGELLWEFDAGTGIMAPPVTYLVDGQQYVSVLAGWGGPSGLWNSSEEGPVAPGYGRLLTFALGADAPFDPPQWLHTEPPTPAIEVEATPAMLDQGQHLYDNNCSFCHGQDVIAGPLPDLRYSTAAVHGQFEQIVRGGLRAPLGMPAFDDLLTSEEVRAIQAYVLERSRETSMGSSP